MVLSAGEDVSVKVIITGSGGSSPGQWPVFGDIATALERDGAEKADAG